MDYTTSTNKKAIKILEENKAILRGHFILSSGKRSDTYIQLFRLFESNAIHSFDQLCYMLAEKIKTFCKKENIDTIVSPALGAIIIGYNIAQKLMKSFVFCERSGIDSFEMKRGFSVNGRRTIIIENVVTTGKSALEAKKCIEKDGGKILGLATIISRTKDTEIINREFHNNFLPLCEVETNEYDADNLPEHLKAIQAIKPGSRPKK